MYKPYFIDGPALISFSGGRSSAYMLHHIVEAHHGILPEYVHVVFSNTGLEAPETLDFVQRVSSELGVTITWLEWAPKKPHFEIVGHNSASLNGEPFKAMVKKKKYLPNPMHRQCTGELKILTLRRYMKSLYPKAGKDDTWTNVVGLRADEPKRVCIMRSNTDFSHGCMEHQLPMADANVTRHDVAAYWKAMDYDLGLDNANGTAPDGNCILCPLKGLKTLCGNIRKRPNSATPMIEMESSIPLGKSGKTATFHKSRPNYSQLVQLVHDQPDLLDILPDQATLPCVCTD